MEKHCVRRLACILVSVLFFAISLVFNGLAVVGISPFSTTTANVSSIFDTQITPSGWTFNIWAVIYIFLIGMNVYILSGLCRNYSYGPCNPPVLPYAFFISWCMNMIFNVSWLFLWDRGMMIPALLIILVVILTNYAMIALSCHGLHIYGAWLNEYHKADLLLFRILVQNGLALYTTWTTIATLINLSIVLTYDVRMLATDAATISLSILTVVLLVWFTLENFVLDKHMRCILTIYPVVIWALSGNLAKNYNAAEPSRNGVFIAVLLALACLLFLTRLVLVIWRSVKQPLYEDPIHNQMSMGR